MHKIKTVNYDGKIIEVEVSPEIYEFDKKNFWEENWRNRKSKQEYSIETNSSLFCSLSEKSFEDKFIENLEIQKLYKAIDKLTKIQKERLILYYFHKLTFEEIAKIQNVSETAIKRNVKDATKNLRKLLL